MKPNITFSQGMIWFYRRGLKVISILLLLIFLMSGIGMAQEPTPEASVAEPDTIPVDAPQVESVTGTNTFTRTIVASKDTYVNQGAFGVNYGKEADLLVERTTVDRITYNKYSFIGFDLSVLPANAVIDSAILQVYSMINDIEKLDAVDSITIVPDALLGAWTELSVTWITKPSQANQGDTGILYTTGWHNINVYNIVSKWQSGALANNGISLRLSGTELGTAIFHSRESGTTAIPRLVVTYHTEGSPALLPVQEDTWINQASPATNYGSETTFRVGGSGAISQYSLLKFAIEDLPDNIEVTSARLLLYSQINDILNVVDNNIYPYLVTSTWFENTVTWNSNVQAVSRGDPGEAYQMEWMDLDVTNIVRDWVAGTYANNGIELRLGVGASTAYDFFARPAQTQARLEVTYTDAPPPCVPLSSASLSGVTAGLTGTAYTFTAAFRPADATPPFIYTFSATDLTTITGPSNSATYTWTSPGTKTVRVEVENCGGTQTATKTVVITNPLPSCTVPLVGVSIGGPVEGLVGVSYNFSSIIEPSSATAPVSYLWEATNQPGTITTQGASYTWSQAGSEQITLTASNCGGTFETYSIFEALDLSELADLVVTNAWFEPDQGRIGFLVKNQGARTAPGDFEVEIYKDSSFMGSMIFGVPIPPGGVRAGYLDSTWSCGGTLGIIEVRADATDAVLEVHDDNNSFSDAWECDLTPPQLVSGPSVSGITETTATIKWKTDDATKSRLTYGWSTAYPSHIDELAANTDHTIALTGLSAGMTYFYDIEAENANGQLLLVDRKYFQTNPLGSDPPEVTSLTLSEYPLDKYEFYTLTAVVKNPNFTQKVEFYWDSKLLGTDYSFSDGFNLHFSPHEEGWTRDVFFGSHTVTAKAINLEGESGSKTETIQPEDDGANIIVQFVKPGEDHIVYYEGTSIPAGTVLPVQIYAYHTEWKCTVSGSTTGNPTGLPGIPCEGMMENVSSVYIQIKKDNETLVHHMVIPENLIALRDMELDGLTAGDYVLSVSGYAGTEFTTVEQNVKIQRGAPLLEVSREVTRTGNYFTVRLAVKNLSGSPVVLEEIQDSLISFQQVGYGTEDPWFTLKPSSYFMSDKLVSRPIFDISYDLASGAYYYLYYKIVPVLYEGMIEPRIGQLPVKVTISGGVVSTASAPGNLVIDPSSATPISLQESFVKATQTADYILVTNPWQADLQYGITNAADLQNVYGAMGRLAYQKNGVLGFMKTYDKWALDVLLMPGKWWSSMLNPQFTETNKGFVLLVGETEVIPSFYMGVDNFVTFVGIPDWIPYSDLPYANISGNTARPELVVGRVIGNGPVEWLKTLQRTIDVYAGVLSWDGSAAQPVSGRGNCVTSNMIPTIKIVDHVFDDANIISSQLHLYDYDHDDRFLAFGGVTQNKDVFALMGHGNPESWNQQTLSSNNASTYNWGNGVPAFFVMSCRTGNYEDSSDNSVAEEYVNNAAAVYVGATQSTEMWSGEWAIKNFVRQWTRHPGLSFGQAMNLMKIDAFAYDTGAFDHGKMIAYMYNLYGDPKYAPAPNFTTDMAVPQTSTSQLASLNATEALSAIEVSLPDFTVDPREDGDFVEIPGGSWLMIDGSYLVPTVLIEHDLAAGEWVQDITLTSRDALTTTTGLSLPRVMSQPFDVDEDYVSDPLPPAPTGWVPALDMDFEWTVQTLPGGGSRLYITIYPFHYDGETQDALYYKDWSFLVETINTEVSLEEVQAAPTAAPLGETVSIAARLGNSGEAADLFVNAEIRIMGTGDLVDSIPLQSLSAVSGQAELAFLWDSTGFPAGEYYANLAVMDIDGRVLAEDSAEFVLGVAAGTVSQFTVSPETFAAGVDEQLHLEITNTGDVPLDGEAVIEITPDGEIEPTEVITHTISGMSPAGTVVIDAAWDTSSETATAFTIKAYLKFFSQTSEPWVVRLDNLRKVYLPLVIR